MTSPRARHTIEDGEALLRERVRFAELLDCYGGLLTAQQRSACERVLEEDCSLSEVAHEQGVTRQGVHDLVARSRKKLEETERALGFLARLEAARACVERWRDRLPERFCEELEEVW